LLQSRQPALTTLLAWLACLATSASAGLGTSVSALAGLLLLLQANSRHTSVGVAHLVGINSGQLPPEIASLDPEADPKGAPFSLWKKAADLDDLWRQSDGLGLPAAWAVLLPGCLDCARLLLPG